MKKKLLLLTLAASAVVAFAAKDPVLMTINGKDVKLSEFEYLYHKNNAQQLEKETLDEYIDRFVVYKLKVADAEAAGVIEYADDEFDDEFSDEFNDEIYTETEISDVQQ